MDLKNAPLHYTKRGPRRLHQRHVPDFPHTLLSAYLCHADVTIPSYSIIHIVSPNKLYLHYKSLPRAPQTQPHTTSNHTWNTATLLFISIFDNYISKQLKRCTKRCGGRRCTRRWARRCAGRRARRCSTSCIGRCVNVVTGVQIIAKNCDNEATK